MRTGPWSTLLISAILAALTATAGATDSLESLELHEAIERIRQLEAELEQQRAELAGTAGSCGCATCNDCCGPSWFDSCCVDPTIAVFFTGDAWRDPRIEDNFGNRIGVDSTWHLTRGIRAQLGASFGIYNYHGSGFGNAISSSVQEQFFLTAGLFQRAAGEEGDRFSWSILYDYLLSSDYADFGQNPVTLDLHQIRFLAGYMFNPEDELGIWGAFGLNRDLRFLISPTLGFSMEAQNQLAVYWRRYWTEASETMLYVGLADPNLEVSLPGLPINAGDDLTEVVLGLRGTVALWGNLGLFGSMHYVIPSATGAGGAVARGVPNFEENWNITFGVVWVRGSSLPLLPIADNGFLGKRSVLP